jgi:putative transposase
MGQATRTTKLLIDLGARAQGGANTDKRTHLEATAALLDEARAFYLNFLLAHAEKFSERVAYYSEHHQEMRERAISANELLTWAEFHTVATNEHPDPWPDWNFSERFPGMPVLYRRSVIKDAIGKVKAYLSNHDNWNRTGKKQGKPGVPGARNHTTLYGGACSLELDQLDVRESFVRLKVYIGDGWRWVNYPVKYSRYFEQRRADKGWEQQSPKLVLHPRSAELHFCQTREVKAKKVKESRLDPNLVTVAVDLNVKNLAVITVRRRNTVIETVFVTDNGLDQQRYRHLKRITTKQWLSGKPVKGEHSNQQLWGHVRRMNSDAARKTAHAIVRVCAKYPGCVLLFERLRKIKARAASKSRRLNRKQANQLRGRINQLSREQAFARGIVTVEVNAHGTSQYCSHYEAQADFNASVNVHHSFFQELHWQPVPSRRGAGDPMNALSGYRSDGRSLLEGHPADGRPGRSADEQTCKVVRLVLAQRGKVPVRIASRASLPTITCLDSRGTGASWTAGRRHKRHLSRIARQFCQLWIPRNT